MYSCAATHLFGQSLFNQAVRSIVSIALDARGS